MKALTMGDQVTNICAGENNPMRHCFFVEYKKKSKANKYKIVHTEHLARCTDKQGSFWNINIDVIYPGWLSSKKCAELWEPQWQAHYGDI